ncbi:hypothetical protein BLNAU_9693 [Blattamonas nauphoetae]|uniref:Uncharacterized protein n=1 Tax=Blattamonas nauphoetae TaxID=2049346 RepID=A0ABQ9XV03_9EUKA|nr:hypothetical protein BLNAU_9693 [Blattamonas nauphoetae]
MSTKVGHVPTSDAPYCPTSFSRLSTSAITHSVSDRTDQAPHEAPSPVFLLDQPITGPIFPPSSHGIYIGNEGSSHTHNFRSNSPTPPGGSCDGGIHVSDQNSSHSISPGFSDSLSSEMLRASPSLSLDSSLFLRSPVSSVHDNIVSNEASETEREDPSYFLLPTGVPFTGEYMVPNTTNMPPLLSDDDKQDLPDNIQNSQPVMSDPTVTLLDPYAGLNKISKYEMDRPVSATISPTAGTFIQISTQKPSKDESPNYVQFAEERPASQVSRPKLSSLPEHIQIILRRNNPNLLPYYLDLFPTMTSQQIFTGYFKHSVSLGRQTGWIACTMFPDNVFCDLRKIHKNQRMHCRSGAMVRFKIILNVKSQSYFSAEQPYLVDHNGQYLQVPSTL